MSFAILLDGMVIVLLAMTIVYAIILNRKLKNLRAGEGEMRAAIERFSTATAQAEANLAQYKEIAGQLSAPAPRESAQAGRALAPLVAEARKLAADLNLLIGRGEALIEERAEPSRTETSLSEPLGSRPELNTLTRPRTAASGRSGRVDMANPAATWPLDEELELMDALKDAR